MRATLTALLLAGLTMAGCGSPSTTAKNGSSETSLANPPSDAAPPPPPMMGKTVTQPGTGPEAKPEVVREKAVVGVGKKGRDYEPGMVTTPVAIYFRGPQMVAFNIQIPTGMKLYYAEHGHFPKTQEEFMQKIIKEGQIKLPELPPGERYIYDAEKAATMRSYDPTDPPLMVEHEK